MTDHKSEHRGWQIEITIARFDATCWITSPNGDEYPVFLPKGYGVSGALSCARARINRLISQQAEAERMMASDEDFEGAYLSSLHQRGGI